MKPKFENPALTAFLAQLGQELLFAQVLIRRQNGGWELRQVEDAKAPVEALRLIKLSEARELAQYTAAGEFRPLKSAPTLRTGWRLAATSDMELATALNHFYPGALADWHAAQADHPPVTNYRDYTGRQSGMYRITTLLDDTAVAGVVWHACDAAYCLKRRMWSVEGLKPDGPAGKSLIPCLEPCAILMESARKTVREMQGERAP